MPCTRCRPGDGAVAAAAEGVRASRPPHAQTVPLDYKEWLVSIAIGAGSWPVSFFVRFISRCAAHRASRTQPACTLPARPPSRARYLYGAFAAVLQQLPCNASNPHCVQRSACERVRACAGLSTCTRRTTSGRAWRTCGNGSGRASSSPCRHSLPSWVVTRCSCVEDCPKTECMVCVETARAVWPQT